jgi:hypothetical protein
MHKILHSYLPFFCICIYCLQLSTKAIISLIENANVNPNYLFLGVGDVFLSDESELETLKKENQELTQRIIESGNMVSGLRDVIKKLEKRNDDLIELSAAAIKYHQGQKEAESKHEEKE